VVCVDELRERAVETDGLLRVVVDCGLDEEDTHEHEDDRARREADRPDQSDPRPYARTPLLDLRVAQEPLRDAAVRVVAPGADHQRARDADDPGSSRPAEHAGRRALRCGRAPVAAEQDVDRERAQDRVPDAAGGGRQPFEAAVGALGAMTERRTREAPERVPAEPDCDERQQEVTTGLLGDRVERSLLVRDRAAPADRELEREQPDDAPDERPSDEAGARKDLEGLRVDEAFAGCPGVANRGLPPPADEPSSGHAISLSAPACSETWAGGTQTLTAPGSTPTSKDLTFRRSPPSSSYRTLRLNLTFTR